MKIVYDKREKEKEKEREGKSKRDGGEELETILRNNMRDKFHHQHPWNFHRSSQFIINTD